MKSPETIALDKAKIQLMQIPNTLFYYTILFSLKLVWDTSEAVKTAATNGTELFINPKFFLTLTEKERIGLLVHEILHVALSHMTRLGDKHLKPWNIAADHVINLSMLETGKYTLPARALCDARFNNMNTESVYKIVVDEAEKEEKKGGPSLTDLNIPGGTDLQCPADAAQTSATEKAVADIVLKAGIQAKAANEDPGSLPGELNIQLQRVLNPKLPWNVILQNFLTGFAKDDYSWRKPNRRYMPEYYLPSAYSEAIEKIAIAVDASGSVSKEEFSYFIAEISTIQETCKPDEIVLIDFDTEIKNIQSITHETDILSELKFKGGGGTKLEEVFEWAKENNPIVMLIFTDGGFHMPDKQLWPDCPIVWLIHNNYHFNAPFGEVIQYEIGD